jgi:hypothetical protein
MPEGPSFIQLPVDGQGKKTRSHVRTVAGADVHEQYVILDTPPLTTRVDEVDANTFYVGKAAIGSAETAAVWQIKKGIKVGTETKILDPVTTGDTFVNRWDQRTTITYA